MHKRLRTGVVALHNFVFLLGGQLLRRQHTFDRFDFFELVVLLAADLLNKCLWYSEDRKQRKQTLVVVLFRIEEIAVTLTNHDLEFVVEIGFLQLYDDLDHLHN